VFPYEYACTHALVTLFVCYQFQFVAGTLSVQSKPIMMVSWWWWKPSRCGIITFSCSSCDVTRMSYPCVVIIDGKRGGWSLIQNSSQSSW